MSEPIQVFVATDSEDDAGKIAQNVVEGKLAACVQVLGPISSTYRWGGDVERAEEWLCLIKSEKELFGELEQSIMDLHPYETPEIIAVPIITGSEGYLDWIEDVVGNDC